MLKKYPRMDVSTIHIKIIIILKAIEVHRRNLSYVEEYLTLSGANNCAFVTFI